MNNDLSLCTNEIIFNIEEMSNIFNQLELVSSIKQTVETESTYENSVKEILLLLGISGSTREEVLLGCENLILSGFNQLIKFFKWIFEKIVNLFKFIKSIFIKNTDKLKHTKNILIRLDNDTKYSEIIRDLYVEKDICTRELFKDLIQQFNYYYQVSININKQQDKLISSVKNYYKQYQEFPKMKDIENYLMENLVVNTTYVVIKNEKKNGKLSSLGWTINDAVKQCGVIEDFYKRLSSLEDMEKDLLRMIKKGEKLIEENDPNQVMKEDMRPEEKNKKLMLIVETLAYKSCLSVVVKSLSNCCKIVLTLNETLIEIKNSAIRSSKKS